MLCGGRGGGELRCSLVHNCSRSVEVRVLLRGFDGQDRGTGSPWEMMNFM